jgi:hypothetical protein
VVIVGIVEQPHPRIAAVKDVVAIATDRGSRSPEHEGILAAHPCGRIGKMGDDWLKP